MLFHEILLLLAGYATANVHVYHRRVTNETSSSSFGQAIVPSPSSSISSRAASIISSSSSSSSSSSTITSAPSTNTSIIEIDGCSATCAAARHYTRFVWVSQRITTEILAAKIIYIVNKNTNTTRTSTSYYTLPDGFTLPPINDAGTRTTNIPIVTELGKTTNLEVAYPTVVLMSEPYYSWWGTLPTINAIGQPVCSTVDTGVQTVPAKAPVNPTPAPDTTDRNDPTGWVYSLNAQICQASPAPSDFPGDAAPVLCPHSGVCPAVALETAKYLTEEETITEDTPPPTETPSTPSEQPPPTSPTEAAKQSPPTNAGTPSPEAQAGAAVADPNPQATAARVATGAIVVNSNTILQNTDGAFVIASQTLSAGGAAINVGGTTIALAAGGSSLVLNGVTQAVQSVEVPVQAPSPTPVLTFNGQPVTANANSAFVIAGQTLQPGSSVVVAGTTIALASGGGNAVVNGVTQQLVPAPTTQPAVITFRGQAVTANSNSAFIINGLILSPGGSLVVSGTTLSLDSEGSTAFVNGVAQALSPATTSSGDFAPILNIGGQVISATEVFVVSGQTLALDHPITLGSGASATTLALTTDASGDTVLISNGRSSTLGRGSPPSSVKSSAKATTTSSDRIGDQIAGGIGLASSTSSSSSGAVSDTLISHRETLISALLVLGLTFVLGIL